MLAMVLLALSAVLPAFHVEVLAFSLEEAEAGVRQALGKPQDYPGYLRPPPPQCPGRRARGWARSLELPSGVQAPEAGTEDQKLCLTSSTCRNSRKSRIRSDSRVICSKAESHTKRSRTLNGRALLIRPAPAQRGCRHEHRAGLGRRKEGSRSWPQLYYEWGEPPLVEKHRCPQD